MVIVTVVAVTAVIFMIPVAFLHVPAVALVLIVRVIPVRAFIRRSLPHTRNPDVAASVDAPVSINPSVSFEGWWWAAFIANRRRRTTENNAEADLCECWYGEGSHNQRAAKNS